MPIYNFQCVDCGRKFEILVRCAGDEIFCPQCQSDKLNRLPSTFGVKSGSNQENHLGRTNEGCGGCPNSSCANYR